jgi:TfoX/Sxy family transcriptional regulator of competence genes
VAKRPRMVPIDDEMQRWCETLIDEVSAWPRVTRRPMFGLVGLYRGSRIFAAVPRTRAVRTATSLLLKLPGSPQARQRAKERQALKAGAGPGAGWVTFEMQSQDDIPEALRWLERAYDKASSRSPQKK